MRENIGPAPDLRSARIQICESLAVVQGDFGTPGNREAANVWQIAHIAAERLRRYRTDAGTACLAACCGIAVPGGSASAVEILAANAAQVSAAMVQAQPGDVVVMVDGTWTNQAIQFAGSGTQANPIMLRPQTPGGVLLNGTSRLSISGNWLVADGLRFEGGALAGGSVIEFRGNLGVARNSRLTNSAIIDYNPPAITTETDWVTMHGQDNRIDHNYFKGHNHIGQTLEVRHTAGTPDRHRIDNNYFADRQPGDGNGWETIRIGLSGVAQSSSFTVVENNLFERVDGENEAISNKSSHNTFRYNTFRDVRATLTLRHGNDATVEGNFFLGENQEGSGGVRVIGERHRIINNYFANIDDGGGAAIAINRGQIDAEPTGYQHVKDAVIAHNTFVNTLGGMIQFSSGASDRPLLAENVTIANNLFRSSGPAIFSGTEGTGWTWEGNIAFGGSLGPKAGAAGIGVVNPQLQLGADGLWRPAASSPVVNAAMGATSSLVPNDFDGQPRLGIADVGADEVSTAAIVRRPLTPGDVGPQWLFDRPKPTMRGFGPGGAAIEAEDFTAMLDPNGNGQTWTIVNSGEAFGGQVIAAPAGDRVDVPGEPHDAIAVYELIFETPGTYTAYYRSRGSNAATNSIYSPAAFGVDPANVQDLSDDGSFTWVKDPQTFTISPALVGVPLEFRLGMREELSQLDALVLSFDPLMTQADLDAIFPPTPGDLNGDEQVTAADWLLFKAGQGANFGGLTPLAAYLLGDLDGDFDHDLADFALFRSLYEAAHGAGAFAQMVARVPEPRAGVLAVGATLIAISATRRH